MPEVTIKYKKAETLKILKSLAKYLDFIVAEKPAKSFVHNGVTIIKGDKSVDINDLTEIFTKNDIDAAQLRKEAWQRK